MKTFKSLLEKLYLNINVAFNMFTSTREIFTERKEMEIRLQKYRLYSLEDLEYWKKHLTRQSSDLLTPGPEPKLHLSEITTLIEEKQEQLRVEEKMQRLRAEQKFTQRTREIREHLGSTSSLPTSP
ncbi:MAG: hypothetical protein KBC22_02070 [Candidatus Pacebacteria bacterium]|nr:hypothetical protein [Candidatus Paceibacterota bacterium]